MQTLVTPHCSPSGRTVNLSLRQLRALLEARTWPRDNQGQEYCSPMGERLGEPVADEFLLEHVPSADRDVFEQQLVRRTPDSEYVVVETMPDEHRDSHRAAGNWGRYPDNGAERRIVTCKEAQLLVNNDPDSYAHIVGGDDGEELCK